MQPHIKISKANKYVLLPGDSGRIDIIARYLDEVKNINSNREYRTCEGTYEGIPLSMVSTGIGCPAAAIAVEELSKLNARTVIRIGTCGGLLKEMQAGDIIIPDNALCFDGTTKEYVEKIKEIRPDEIVVWSLKKAAEKIGVRYFTGTNRTHDAFYEPIENFIRLKGKNVISSEMECSAVFLVSKLRGLMAAAILVVNTPEVPEEVEMNPDSIYTLTDVNKVRLGIEKAIQISLEAIKIMENFPTKLILDKIYIERNKGD